MCVWVWVYVCMGVGVFTIIYSADTYAGEDVIFSFCTIPLVDSETRRNSEGKSAFLLLQGGGVGRICIHII